MTTLRNLCCLLITALFFGLPSLVLAQELSPASPSPTAQPFDGRPRRSIGAPQVLEIPSAQKLTPPGDLPPTTEVPSASALPPVHERVLGAGDPNDDGLRPEATMPIARRNYLGVLYATAEEGAVGVKVLDVVQGSPAARAGFQGVNAPESRSSDLIKGALVLLAMSPVGAFAIPLIIAHDMYSASQTPGDLIVAVGDHQVHDAQEFSEEIRRYQPGDAVTFSVLRKGKPMQVTVQLEEEPMDVPEQTAAGGSLPASRGVLNGPVGISISVP